MAITNVLNINNKSVIPKKGVDFGLYGKELRNHFHRLTFYTKNFENDRTGTAFKIMESALPKNYHAQIARYCSQFKVYFV